VRKVKDLMKLRIGVIMGGLSSEREISLLTGKAVVNELKGHGHDVAVIDLNSRSFDKITSAKIDVAIIALHGTYGEDGVIQGILEFLDIPYAGSGVLASALGMNKIMTKMILEANNIRTPGWSVVEKEKDIKKIGLKYPLVFKPEAQGSAVGVTIVKAEKDAIKAYRKAARYCKRVLVEKYIKGTEITAPVLGDDRVLPIIEIVPANEFYDYDAKYTPGKSTHIIPARISKKVYKTASETAIKVHKALMCRDLSRTDMIVAGNDVFVLETNTLPGMTSLSLYPEAAKAAGISFYELIMIFVKNAVERKD
jgi:D-alanine-D-alanine ligase